MASSGLWVAVLAVSFIAAVAVDEQGGPLSGGPLSGGPFTGGPQQDPRVLCTQYSRDGQSVNMAAVFDLVMVHYQYKIRDMGTERLREFMNYADDDKDSSLNMAECAKLIQYLNEQ